MESLPHWVTIIFSIVFGLILGSFLNVVILRLPLDESIVKPRSRCPHCKKRIRWSDNIPVLSYVILRGKCRQCAAPISTRYPLVEILTALLFVTCTIRFGWNVALFLRHWPLMMIFVAVTFIDLDHHIIRTS
jgi:leader peptidase (prepilin peptidase)/N-methyltransferase